MNYSVNNLTNVADCNVLLSRAAKEKADLQYKRTVDLHFAERYAESSVDLAAQLQVVIAEIAAAEVAISMLPAGEARDKAEDKKVRLEYRKFSIENRIEESGVIALLGKEMDVARIEQQLSEVDAFIAAVTTKREALLN